MQKTAQKRSILNKLREMTNISGQAAEKFFNPEFQKVMESLREKDNTIRSLVAGQEVDGGDPGPDPISLKTLFKSAKTNFNRREYMTAIAELGRFHKKVFDISKLIDNLKLDVDQVHHEFLFKDLGDDYKQQLHDLKTRFAKEKNSLLIKEASIMDFLHNITSKRGRALALWEKRYPQQIKKLKSDTGTLLSKSEGLLSQILNSLKEMASARAVRDVDKYMKSAEKISKNFSNYDTFFKNYYSSNIKGFLDKIELISPTTPVDSKELGKQDIPVSEKKETINEPSSNLPIPLTNVNAPKTIVEGPPSNMVTDSVKPSDPYAPTILAPIPGPPTTPNDLEVKAPDTIPTPAEQNDEEEDEFASDRLAKEMWGKPAHKKFFNTLQALSKENPVVLKKFIKKYANSIQGSDLELAIKLLKISNLIE